ncbi:MAG: hypothetical protein P4L50_22040 [Anaerolineaceae bacterium]|nr:hypothetical protein [Anaerolineaceae bacterium]
MRTFARITAVVLMILGVLVILGGLAGGVAGLIRAGMQTSGAVPRLGAARTALPGLGLFVMIFSIIQGLLLVAFGEMIFLLTDVVHNTRSYISQVQPQ